MILDFVRMWIKNEMKRIIYILFTICCKFLMISCENIKKNKDNVIHSTHAYDIIKLNDTTYMSVPSGLTWDGDTMKCEMFKIK